jgi:hypothetical protein
MNIKELAFIVIICGMFVCNLLFFFTFLGAYTNSSYMTYIEVNSFNEALPEFIVLGFITLGSFWLVPEALSKTMLH